MSNVLLVDDERGYRDYLQHGLAESDIQVQATASAGEAKRILDDRGVDLLVTDIRLPNGTDGLELADWARERDAELALLVITGYGSSQYEQRSRDLGAYAYLEKPFELPTLRCWVRRALERQRLVREVHRLEQDLAATRAAVAESRVLAHWAVAWFSRDGDVLYASPEAMTALEAVSDPAAPRPIDRLEASLLRQLRDALPDDGRIGRTDLCRRDGVLAHFTALVRDAGPGASAGMIALFVDSEVELGNDLWLDILFRIRTLGNTSSRGINADA